MKKRIWFLLFTLSLSGGSVYAQLRQGTIMIHAGADAYKTDNDPLKIADKAQLGAEINFFVATQLPLNAGVEIQSKGNTALTLGLRYYLAKPVFLRFRGFLSKETDVALGIGYSRFFTSRWALEVLGDYYFQGKNLGLRVGISRFFR